MNKSTFRKKLVKFVEKYELWFYGSTAVLYLIGIPLSILVFPDASLATYVLLSFTGITSSIGALATALLTADQNKREKGKDNEE
jgi:hypothetical protein